jgi:hypothetical protein
MMSAELLLCMLVRNHHATLAAWRQFVPQAADSGMDAEELAQIQQLQLLKPGETRFASAFIMLERVDRVKAKLQQLVVSDRWAEAVQTLKTADRVRRVTACKVTSAQLPPTAAAALTEHMAVHPQCTVALWRVGDACVRNVREHAQPPRCMASSSKGYA